MTTTPPPHGSIAQRLCDTFRERARETHTLIEHSANTGLGVGEETITDVNLIDIAFRHQAHVRTFKYSKWQEGKKSGADWLWCIGKPGRWLNVLIQAKLADPFSKNVVKLNYRNGHQRKLLLTYAPTVPAVPLFCIYGEVPLRPPIKAGRSCVSGTSRPENLQWACSLLWPAQVAALVKLGMYRIGDVIADALPWMCLFCDAGVTIGDLADRAAQSLHNARARAAQNANLQLLWSPDDPDPLTLIRPDLPQIAADVLNGRARANRASPVAAVQIISSDPLPLN